MAARSAQQTPHCSGGGNGSESLSSLKILFLVLLDQAKSTERSSTAKSSGCRHPRSLSGHKRLRCFALPLRALAPMPSLHPLFSQSIRAGRRSAMYGRKQIISVARSAQQTPHCEKTGRRTGGGCAVENAGASLPSSVLGASGGRSPSFSPGGHFWCHLLVSKGGKNCCSQETPNRRCGMLPEVRIDFFCGRSAFPQAGTR